MSSPINRRNDRTLMIGNRVLMGEEQINDYCKRHGLCNVCGRQTHKKAGTFNRGWDPMTVEDDKGNVTVYKGYCIQATCYSSVEKVKEILGEIPKKKPRSSNPSSPAINTSPFKIKSPFSTNSSGSQKKPFQPDSVYKPPMVPNLNRDDSFKYSDVSTGRDKHDDRNQSSSGYVELSSTMEGLPSEREIKEMTKMSAIKQMTTRRTRAARHSSSSESDISVSLYDPDGSGSRITGSFRSSLSSSNLGFPERGLAREHSHLLLNSSKSSRRMSESGIDRAGGDGAIDDPIHELKTIILEGDYVKFINELDRRCANGVDEGEKDIVLEGLRLFRHHVVTDQLSKPNGVVLPGDNWVKTIRKKISDCLDDKDIVISCLLTLLTFSTLPGKYKKSILNKGGIEETLRLLDRYKGDKEIPSLDCSLFVSLGLSEKDGLNAKTEKVTLLVRRLVAMVTHNEWGRDFALRALYHFAYHRRKSEVSQKSLSHDVKSCLAKEKELQALCGILKEEKVRETAVEAALSLIWRMSGPKEKLEENNDFLPVSSGVVDSILIAMDTFNSTAIRESGCGILANMAMRDAFPSEMIEASLVSIQNFLSNVDKSEMVDEGLATCAMHAICNLLQDCSSVNISLPVCRNVIEAVLGVMNRFPESHELVEFACLIIAHASRNNQRSKQTVMALSGFDQVNAAFEKFVTRCDEPSLEVKDAALCALASLTGCRTGAEAVLRSGLLDILKTLLAVETDKDFADILEIVVKNTENGVSGGFDLASQDLENENPNFDEYLKNATSESDLLDALQSLVGVGHVALDAALAEGRGLVAITETLSQHRRSKNVQEAGLALLAEIYFYVPSQIKPFKGPAGSQHQREVLQIVDMVMELHREVVDIQTNGCLVILNLMAGIGHETPDRNSASSMMERCLNRLLETLLFHDSKKMVQKNGIAALGACITVAEESVLQGWNAKIVRQLLESLAHCTGDNEIQINVLDVFLILLRFHHGVDSIGDSIAIKMLLDLLSNDSPDVSIRAAAVLALLADNNLIASSRIVESADSISRLLSCIPAHQDDQNLQICIVSILESLISVADTAASQIIKHNGVSILCNSMSIHRRNGDLVIHTCNILASIFPWVDIDSITAMSDVIKLCLIDALERHVENADVEASVFDAICATCRQAELFKRLFSEESRIRIILSVMQMNLGSYELQRSGCCLLWMLSSASSGKEKVGRCGGIATVVNALLAHNTSTAVQKEGLTALKNLAISSSNKRMLSEAGVENAVRYSLWIHYRDPQVISIGLSAMNNIAVDSTTRSVAEMNDQTLQIVITAMGNFSDNADVQKNACFYLKSCSYLPSNLALMKQREKILTPLLLQAADLFPEQCRDRACSVVTKMQQ